MNVIECDGCGKRTDARYHTGSDWVTVGDSRTLLDQRADLDWCGECIAAAKSHLASRRTTVFMNSGAAINTDAPHITITRPETTT